MTLLSKLLEDHLKGWQDDLTPAWRSFFRGVDPNVTSLTDAEKGMSASDIYPPRLMLAGVQRKDKSPVSKPHMARAFDGLTPDSVRVVVLGQDPYPERDQATGRAFEDGKWKGGRPEGLAKSLKPLLLAALAMEHDKADLFQGLCCAYHLLVGVSPSPDGLIPLPL